MLDYDKIQIKMKRTCKKVCSRREIVIKLKIALFWAMEYRMIRHTM